MIGILIYKILFLFPHAFLIKALERRSETQSLILDILNS